MCVCGGIGEVALTVGLVAWAKRVWKHVGVKIRVMSAQRS